MSNSAISELQELMVKHKKAMPTYNCIEDKMVDKNLHEFKIKVTCDNATACGTGSTKKLAKEDAAKQILANFKMLSRSNKTLTDNVDSSCPDHEHTAFSVLQGIKPSEKRKSAICELQELVTKNRKTLPTYDCIEGSILENIPRFTMKVTCDDTTACGSGSNKKEAKENAAKKMLAIMKINPCSKETANKNVVQKLSAALFTDNELKNVKTANASDKTNKSAISELQELMVKTKQIPPIYDYIGNNAVGPNLYEFMIRVTCCNLKVCQAGPTKKAAKEKAAKEMLSLLQIGSRFKETEQTENKNRKRSNNSPIHLLEEFMVKREKAMPTYETVDDNNEKGNSIKDTCEDKTAVAIENNKDEATINAARNMLNIVRIPELKKNISSSLKLSEE